MDYSDPYKEFSFMSLPKMKISKNQKQIWVPQKYHHQVGFFLQEKEKIPYKNGFIDTDLVVDSDGD
jgi:hypothetical protein